MEIKAPWTDEQVEGLNAFQHSGVLHEFTCGKRDNHKGEGLLRATNDGWVCDECDYTQNWAHAFQVSDWRQLLDRRPFMKNPLTGKFEVL